MANSKCAANGRKVLRFLRFNGVRISEPASLSAAQKGQAGRHWTERDSKSLPSVPAKNREFASQHDDLKLLQLLRPNAQNHEFQHPANQHVTQRHEHEASYVAGYAQFYAAASSGLLFAARASDRIRVYAPFTTIRHLQAIVATIWPQFNSDGFGEGQMSIRPMTQFVAAFRVSQ